MLYYNKPMSIQTRTRSIADLDQQAIEIQHLVKTKKNNLVTEYNNLLKNVEENPYLQPALNAYTDLIAADKEIKAKQINALETLLQGIDINADKNADRNAIQREIKRIKENK
jgi:hypothetical protein